MQRNFALVLLMLFILGLVLLRESRMGFATPIEARFSDWVVNTAGLRPKEAPLALVGMDDSTDVKVRDPLLGPIDFAMFLRAGLLFQPSLLAIEEVLTWPPPKSGDPAARNMKILHDQVLLCPKLVLGAELGFPDDPDLVPPLQNVPSLRHVKGNPIALAEFPIVGRQPLEELRLSAPIGFTNLPKAASPARRVPLIFRYYGQVVPSFVLQSAILWLQLTPEEIQVELGSFIQMGDQMRIPIDEEGWMTIDPHSQYSRMGLDDLLLVASQLEAKTTPLIAPETLNRKLILLARTDLDARILRLPSGVKASTGELFASAIATIQNRQFAQRAGWGVDLLIISGVLLLSRYIHRLTITGAVFTAVMVVPVYLMTALTLFASTRIWLPAVLPFGLILFAVIFRVLSPDSLPKQEA